MQFLSGYMRERSKDPKSSHHVLQANKGMGDPISWLKQWVLS